jgi:hypothetical protein
MYNNFSIIHDGKSTSNEENILEIEIVFIDEGRYVFFGNPTKCFVIVMYIVLRSHLLLG